MLATTSYFSMDAYPGSQRAEAWRDALGHLSLRPGRLALDASIHGIARSIVSPLGISFARLASCPQDFSSCAESGEDGIWLSLHLSGRAKLASDGATNDIAPGDITYGPLRGSFGISFLSDFQEFFVKIPRRILDARLLTPIALRAGYLPGHSGIGRVFAGMLGSLAETIETLDPAQLRPVEIALTEFLATCLVSSTPAGMLRGATTTQMALLNRLCQLIEARLGESNLTLAAVAEAENISPRYVQKLFDNAGETFAHYLRLRRLERCRAELINPLYAHLSITDICFRWGFNDAAHFSRAFREEYGTSPRGYRKTVGAKIEKNALLRISRGWPDGADKALRKASGHLEGCADVDRLARKTDANVSRSPITLRDDRSSGVGKPKHHYLPANHKTVHWGYFSRVLQPILTIASGEVVTIETLTHHANDDYERMIKGDSGAESVFRWDKSAKNVDRRGAGPLDGSILGRGAGEGFGVHLCTGPVALQGAEPGDVIEVRILHVRPRPSANARYAGRAFGSNAAAWWGFQYKELLTEPKPREVVTIYEVDCAEQGAFARAVYNFRWTPQTDPSGVVHPTIDYPGVRVDHATIAKNHHVLPNIRIPLRPHFGVLGLAPKEADIVDSIPPSYFGGNLDNWRAGPGSTIYLPVSVPGGLFSVGDPHASQGDSELCGTAIECSLTGEFQLILHKKRDLVGTPLVDVNYPLLETPKEWVVHGFTFANYLAELGEMAQSEIYKRSSLDPAMRDAFWKMRRFLMMTKGLSEDEAISLMSVAVDFGITQVVDGNWCVHALLRKELFTDGAK